MNVTLQYIWTRTHSYVPLIKTNETSKDLKKATKKSAVKKAMQEKIVD